MKILLLGVQLTSLVNFRGPLMRDLIAAGHEVVAIAPEPAEPWLSQLNALGARYIEAPIARTGLNPLKDAKSLIWLWRKLRTEKPDVVFAFQAKAVIYGIPAAWLAGIKRRVAMIEGLGQGFVKDGPQSLKRRVLGAVLPALYWLGLRKAQTVLFLNPDDEAEFRQLGIIRHQKTVQIPGIGVDLVHFSQQPLPAGPPVFLMLARLLIDKGVREFAAAAKAIRKIHPEARFQLLGALDNGPAGITRAELESYQDIEYPGAVVDVRPHLAACHAFVLPTAYREGLPRSILEAMATGRAIITTDVPGARETVVDLANGYLVKPRDTDALISALVSLIEQPHLLAQMGQASRQMAESRYEVGQINRLIIAELE